MLNEAQKQVMDKAFIKCDGDHDECVYAAGAALLVREEALWMRDGARQEYYHDAHCNALRKLPMGEGGCSCFMYQRATTAEDALAVARRGYYSAEDVENAMYAEYGGTQDWIEDFREKVIARLTAQQGTEDANAKRN